jgi:phage tail-like protein
MINLDNFLWHTMPDDLIDADTYKDSEGKGLLERFISIFDKELQEELVIKLENFANELNPTSAADQFLTLIAYSVGSPPDVMGGIDKYRQVLTSIISIYQIKGTVKSYKAFFNLFGLDCDIIEYFPGDNNYDVPGNIYDNKGIVVQPYDQNEDNVGYIDYDLTYYNLPGNHVAPLSPENESRMMEAVIQLLQPIDCRLRQFKYANAVKQGLSYTLPFILPTPY